MTARSNKKFYTRVTFEFRIFVTFDGYVYDLCRSYNIDVIKLPIIAIPLKNEMTVIGQFHNIDVITSALIKPYKRNQ